MTELTGASDIIAPPQPPTPEVAAARLEELKTDADFQKRAAALDPTAFAERTKLWRIAHGMTPEPEAPLNTIDVMKEADARELVNVQAHAESLRVVGLNETQIYEYINGRPVPFLERQAHERELAKMQKDKAFIQRYMDGDPDARLRMRLVHAGLSMPVGTQEQIAAWERAHAGKKPTQSI